MKNKLLALALLWCSFSVFAQEYFPENSGVKNINNNYTAFTNAKIYVTPTQVIENGTLLIHNGKVVGTGNSVKIPENSVVIDLKGKYIYPSFVDMYTDFGINKPQRQMNRGRSAQYDASREGFYWNDHVMPENKAIEKFSYDANRAKGLVNLGFGTVNSFIPDGIIRGTSILVALNSQGTDGDRILDDNLAQHLSFQKSVTSSQAYPSSVMGAMALIRQMYYDAKWYADGNSKTKDLSLEALNRNKNLPQIFEADSKLYDLRADKIGNEFGINYIIKGGIDEYELIDDIKATKASYILPLDFPDAYDVSNPYLTSKISLMDMKEWNEAPANPAIMAKNGITFALTTADLKKVGDFKENLMKAIQYGLDKTTALEALTTIPAKLLGKTGVVGSLKDGAYANFLITSGEIFEDGTTLYENWVQGNKNILEDMNIVDVRGDYTLNIDGTSYNLSIKGSLDHPKTEITKGDTKIASKMTYADGWINLFYNPEGTKEPEFVRLVADITKEGNISGTGTSVTGEDIKWSATKTAEAKADKNEKKDKPAEILEIEPVTYPNKTFGTAALPKQQDILFKNATVWTSEDAGVLENTDVLVKNGKIAKIGKNLSADGATVIDATGKHLTAGIVDEHSHLAATSINEGGHNSSAEVQMSDVIDPDDPGIYRDLSGGVTTIQILHGSANPIGGQSALIKLKWGEDPDGLLIDNAPKFIKFALGENVKQSNWSGGRFPQSRMGVEQVYVDYFTRAQEYEKKWKTYNSLSSKEKSKTTAPRYDEEMETLVEILNGERFITCHSYVQSEINMLMKVAEKFGFRVNTFTHILEGYKLADKMKEHGVGGSTFSDWWAYKYEVKDAIPYNAAIMSSQGVTVAINSDDAEMSRRLNQEAAKSVKYGGMSQEDAWKMVTINPAKLLHLDNRLGSIKEGKDADLVLWNNNPLSIYAIAEKTMIEGAFYYDYEKMQQEAKAAQEEKSKLINMMLEAKNKGMRTQAPKPKEEKLLDCDSMIYAK
ncbi:amidohydrolase family protein [Zhouia sp. PK063]|uniref:amidohydrolase family protein n=1 Tax=Zhouia sp. PK063 TaxID=3373602 RepID=UPI003791ADEC